MVTIDELAKNHGAEIAALILTCRVFLNTAEKEALEQFCIKNESDGALFYKIAKAHNMRPVVFNVISNLNIKDEIAQKFRADSQQITLRNFEQFRELLKLNTLFEQAGVTAIPYKGCLYGHQFYNDISLRESSDIDFLVDPDINIINQVEKLMVAAGYTAGTDVPEKFKEFYFSNTREFKFFLFKDGKRKFLVEFHTSLNDKIFETQSPIPNDYLFDDLKDELLSGAKIRTLSPTKHVVAMLSHHGIAGQWASLKNVMDLAVAIKNGNKVNWDTAHNCSETYRFNKTLNTGLCMATDLFGISPPFQQKSVANIRPWLDRLFSHHLHPIDRSWRSNIFLKIRAKDSLSDSLKIAYRHIVHSATPSILDYNFVRLPKALYFMYVFVKPLRMLAIRLRKD